MANAYLQGIQTAFENQAQVRNDIYAVTSNWFINRCPLVTRVPRVPVGSTTFTIVRRGFRTRTATVGSPIGVTDTTIALLDASPFMNGDVLEMVSGEDVEIIADPNLSTNVITVRRGIEGTTAAAGSIGDPVRLISNSRSGAEIDQTGVAQQPVGIAQFCQTWQHPVQVGGSLQASTGYAVPGPYTPFDQNKMIALQNLMDDMEVSSYYGKGEDPATVSRPKQKGLRALIQTNLVTSPVNAGAYKASDLIRDTLQACRANGGNPDVLLLAPNFMSGLATWGLAAQRIDAGVTVFGEPIKVFEAPMLGGGVAIIEAPLLKPYTAICLTSAEARMRMKRNEFWQPRGSRGDAYEGDWIAEGAVELDNESHHAWVEGITAFSAT
jgi:hypothetical protein